MSTVTSKADPDALAAPVVVPGRRPRIVAINMVRLFVISLVIATHIVSSGPLYGSFFSGCIWMISHTSRFLFIILTALVLMYNYGPERKFSIATFYVKRFTLVAIPYATWTLIYQLQDGLRQHTVADFLQIYWHNFITAGAMYHLYFLLVSMQMYLLFPLLRAAYIKLQKHPWWIVGVAFAIQLFMTIGMQYFPSTPGLRWWLENPSNYVWSYVFYIAVGMVVAEHLVDFRAFVLRHTKVIVWSTVFMTWVGILYYLFQYVAGGSVVAISAVNQPYILVAVVIYGLFISACAFRWVEAGEPGGKFVAAVAEDSFGIYLSHPLFLLWLSQFQPAIKGFYHEVVAGAVTLIILLPLVYGIAFIFSEIARRTPLSIFLTGRHQAVLKKSFIK